VTAEQCWSTEQARAFIAATADHEFGPLWALLLGTGLRRGEAVGLLWTNVDLDAGLLHVRRSVTLVRGAPIVDEYGGKTDAAYRTIVLGPDLGAILREHRKEQNEDRLAAGPAWQDTGAVFAEEDGREINPGRVSGVFTRTVAAAKLPAIGLHGTRHTHATMLLRDGVPVPAVAQRLGHEDAAITLSTYTHFVPADDVLAADATSRILFDSA
jgi:integrase